MWDNYYLVTSLDEALELLAHYRESARIIAGGTDIILEIEHRVRPGVKALIDITRVPGLDSIQSGSDDMISLGPLVTHNDCVASPLVRQRAWPLVQACWEVGAPQIRNRATVAGNLITASPANDTITPLMALDARVTLRSVKGERNVPLNEFYTGVRRTIMAPDEVLTGIHFRGLNENERGMFIKVGLRKFQAISVVNIATIIEIDDHTGMPVVKNARIALGAVAPTVVRASQAEAYLKDRVLDDETLATAAALVTPSIAPIDDIRGTAEYRREVAGVITRRTLTAIREKHVRGWVPDNPVMLRSSHASQPALVASTAWQAHSPEQPIVTMINGQEYSVHGVYDKTLLQMLRDDLHLIGTKEGCAEGECGACTVFLDGAAVMSCLVPAARAHGSQIITIEGLQQDGRLHPVQQAFIDEGAVQCGYCTPGLVMSAAKLLEERRQPTRWEAQQAIAGNLCRCTGYYKILNAIEKAGELG